MTGHPILTGLGALACLLGACAWCGIVARATAESRCADMLRAYRRQHRPSLHIVRDNTH